MSAVWSVLWVCDSDVHTHIWLFAGDISALSVAIETACAQWMGGGKAALANAGKDYVLKLEVGADKGHCTGG